MNPSRVTIIGGGLAGCEAAFQLATRGVDVVLHEQKPLRRTPAQQTDRLAELVCSNSLRGAALTNAVGLLKEEMRRMGSLIVRTADATKVPAGGALAVDRERFADAIEREIKAHPRIELVAGEIESLPSRAHGPVIVATGPLTSDALAADLERLTGGRLAYYDAIAPIVASDGIDHDKVFAASRWDKGEVAGRVAGSVEGEAAQEGGDRAYLNAPMNRDEYEAFIDAVIAAEKVVPRDFESVRYFEGCLPIEVMAERGRETLRHGPMKPVGLTDPRTGRWPYAVVQLRQEDEARTAWNLVGFQTRMTFGAQAKVFRMIPGLENVEIQRFGSVHRNTFVEAPKVLDGMLRVRGEEDLYLAGQLTGVEGYVESAACGFLCGVMLARKMLGLEVIAPPKTTAFGGLLTHLARDPGNKIGFQPSNITWSCVPPLANERDERGRRLQKAEKYALMATRALEDLATWRTAMEGRMGDAEVRRA